MKLKHLVIAAVVIGGGAFVLKKKGRAMLRALESPGGGRIKNKRDPAPADLVEVTGVNGRKLKAQKDAAAAFQSMVAAAHGDGIDKRRLGAFSIYRPSASQKKLFDQAVKRYGSPGAARKWVAPPGGSAHQSGRAFDLDLDGGGIGSQQVERLRKAPAYAWLVKNAARFGFYPYKVEPWHWEYNPPAVA